jgi:hypothetical protein
MKSLLQGILSSFVYATAAVCLLAGLYSGFVAFIDPASSVGSKASLGVGPGSLATAPAHCIAA